jgi:hypothetical protein
MDQIDNADCLDRALGYLLFTGAQQLAQFNPQTRGKLLGQYEGRISEAAFNARYVCPVDPGRETELLLRPAFLQPQPAHVCAKDFSNIHHPTWAAIMPIRLRTISHISLDFPMLASN